MSRSKVKGQGHQGQKQKLPSYAAPDGPISRESLNGFEPNSQKRRVWSFPRMNLNVKVKGQGDQRQKCVLHCHHPSVATEWNALATNDVTHWPTGPFGSCRGYFRGLACGVFGKTSLALVMAGHYIFMLWFLSSSIFFFPRLI